MIRGIHTVAAAVPKVPAHPPSQAQTILLILRISGSLTIMERALLDGAIGTHDAIRLEGLQ
jgi:hypothetical protein